MSIDQQPTIKTTGAPTTPLESTAEVRPVTAVVPADQQQGLAGADEPEKEEVK